MKKSLILGIVLIALFPLVGLSACTKDDEDSNMEWTNGNAVYAYIKAGYETDILNDIESAFSSLPFQKVFVTEKNVNERTPLALLFIIANGAEAKQQELIELLNQDARINHASVCRDLPFETVDTRYIDKAKDTIAIDETLTLQAKGSIDYYIQPFSFKGFLIKPLTNKNYTVSDFPQVDLKLVEVRDNGWLYLELKKAGYFEVIKAINTLSRLSLIGKSGLDKSELVSVIPPIWQTSDSSIADFESMAGGGYPTAVIKGRKAGKVTIDFGGVSCEITVI